MLTRRYILFRVYFANCRRFVASDTDGEELFKRNETLERRFGITEKDEHSSASALKVKEFFQKHRSPPKPSPPQPRKEWLLRRRPEPEEITEKPSELPPFGDIEAEKEWLNFGTHKIHGRQELITQTTEFKQIAQEIDREMGSTIARRQRSTRPTQYVPAFTADSKSHFRRELDPDLLNVRDLQMDWTNTGISNKRLSIQLFAVRPTVPFLIFYEV